MSENDGWMLETHVRAFIRTHCLVGRGHRAYTDDLYAAFEEWCHRQNRLVFLDRGVFGKALRAASCGHIERRRNGQSGRYWYDGIGLLLQPRPEQAPVEAPEQAPQPEPDRSPLFTVQEAIAIMKQTKPGDSMGVFPPKPEQAPAQAPELKADRPRIYRRFTAQDYKQAAPQPAAPQAAPAPAPAHRIEMTPVVECAYRLLPGLVAHQAGKFLPGKIAQYAFDVAREFVRLSQESPTPNQRQRQTH